MVPQVHASTADAGDIGIEVAKLIVRGLLPLTGVLLPAVGVGLIAGQVVVLSMHYRRHGRINPRFARRVLLLQHLPLPSNREVLRDMVRLLSAQTTLVRQAIELARAAAGRAITMAMIEAFLGAWQLLRGAYEDALGELPAPPRPPGQHYPGRQRVQVQAGESLSIITLREWGDALLWPLLYDANVATIGPNHNLVRAGMSLVLPDISALSRSELDRARQRGRSWR